LAFGATKRPWWDPISSVSAACSVFFGGITAPVPSGHIHDDSVGVRLERPNAVRIMTVFRCAAKKYRQHTQVSFA
jgi:hypothetical protein